MRLPHIDTNRCTGCGWCVAACPPRVLSLQVQAWRKRSVLHAPEACTGCSLCERRCPFGVINMVKTSFAPTRDGSEDPGLGP